METASDHARQAGARLLAVLVLAVALAAPVAAQAAWFRAETDRFIVYSQGREEKARNLAVKLSAYDAVLRIMNPGAAQRPPTRKLEVYLLSGPAEMKLVVPDAPQNIGGFYTTSAMGLFAFAYDDPKFFGADDVLFHEYAHHFMRENFPAAYPAWFSEGWAEYFMTTQITPSGAKVGAYNEGRVSNLLWADWLPMETVLSKDPSELTEDEQAMYYAQSWFLMHWLRSDEARTVWANKASAAIAVGVDPVKAMQDATGMDMAKLTFVLKRYTKLPMLVITNPTKPAQVTVTALPESASDLLLPNARLSLSDASENDTAFLAEVRRRAARYPRDRLAELTLARAEFMFGDVAKAEALLAPYLVAEPANVELLLLAGEGQLNAAQRPSADLLQRTRAARPYLGRAYQLDKGDYRVLLNYAQSRSVEAAYPTDNDIKVLLEARVLAPSVERTSIMAGSALLKSGRRDEAVKILTPIANSPHGGRMWAYARALVAGKSLDEADAAASGADVLTAPPQLPPAPKGRPPRAG